MISKNSLLAIDMATLNSMQELDVQGQLQLLKKYATTKLSTSLINFEYLGVDIGCRFNTKTGLHAM
jgi:hypothetical protein